MFFEYLDKIRNLSESKRKFISFSVSLFITGLIFILWYLLWIPSDIEKTKYKTENIKEEKNETSLLKDNFNNLIKNIKDIKESGFSSTIDFKDNNLKK